MKSCFFHPPLRFCNLCCIMNAPVKNKVQLTPREYQPPRRLMKQKLKARSQSAAAQGNALSPLIRARVRRELTERTMERETTSAPGSYAFPAPGCGVYAITICVGTELLGGVVQRWCPRRAARGCAAPLRRNDRVSLRSQPDSNVTPVLPRFGPCVGVAFAWSPHLQEP